MDMVRDQIKNNEYVIVSARIDGAMKKNVMSTTTNVVLLDKWCKDIDVNRQDDMVRLKYDNEVKLLHLDGTPWTDKPLKSCQGGFNVNGWCYVRYADGTSNVIDRDGNELLPTELTKRMSDIHPVSENVMCGTYSITDNYSTHGEKSCMLSFVDGKWKEVVSHIHDVRKFTDNGLYVVGRYDFHKGMQSFIVTEDGKRWSPEGIAMSEIKLFTDKVSGMNYIVGKHGVNRYRMYDAGFEVAVPDFERYTELVTYPNAEPNESRPRTSLFWFRMCDGTSKILNAADGFSEVKCGFGDSK